MDQSAQRPPHRNSPTPGDALKLDDTEDALVGPENVKSRK
jgi:hypothetical protein